MIRVDGDRERAEDHLDVPIGTVLRDETSVDQVFLGWRRNAVGCDARAYAREEQRYRYWLEREPYIYHASMLDTLLRKFPGLKDYPKRRTVPE